MKKILVLLAAAALICAFTLPATASEGWDFYGSARIATWYQNVTPGSVPGQPDPDSDLDLAMRLQGTARIGATVKKGNIGGGFEYGPGVNVRKLYGTYNFGGGEILVGQTYTPIDNFYSNQVWGDDEDLLTYGQAYDSRQPMLQLQMNTLKIALVAPSAGCTDLGTGGDVDILVPKLEISYQLKTDAFFIDFIGGFHYYSIDKAFGNDSVSVTSGLVGIGGGVDMGPAYARLNAFYGMNGGQFGIYAGGGGAAGNSAGIDNAKKEVIDNYSLGFMGVLGFKASDMINVEAGAGMISNELDVDNSKADEALAVYLQATITVADGFYIIPEVGYFDYKDNAAGADEGDMTYFGAKWQINF